MAAISFAGAVVGILAFAGVRLELTTNQSALLVSVCPITMIAALWLATLHYKVDATRLRLYIGFIDVFGGKVNINRILNIVIKEGKMFISYLYEGNDPIIAAIVINPKYYEDMKNALRAKNPDIVFFEDDNETSCSE
ncbi:MAG: hypothetical protein NC332_04590 [Firmicutes bacterium]|nr:hypothetical protein [Bacillota bacterium]